MLLTVVKRGVRLPFLLFNVGWQIFCQCRQPILAHICQAPYSFGDLFFAGIEPKLIRFNILLGRIISLRVQFFEVVGRL